MIKLFDSMTKTKKVLSDNKTVNLYLCGPTVYNYIHIGNARPVVVIDVLHRLLIHQKYQINYVHNITDIDDKIINEAKKENTTETIIADKYLSGYLEDLKTLNIITPTKLPKVTDFIPDITTFISDLISKDAAYVSGEDVYFKVESIKDYGVLSNKNLKDLKLNLKVNKTELKKSPLDFALWKSTKEGVKWDSPWGKGRPGWHTECAVFIQKLFNGQTINLHGGGVDLKFPHHENERAQFLAHNDGRELSSIWWHNGHINFDDEKMSKSLNNVILVKDFCTTYHPFVLRYLILNHDHHQPIFFTNTLIIEALNTIKKYDNILKLWVYYNFINDVVMSDNIDYDKGYYQLVIDFLNDDISTTNAFTVIASMVKDLHQAITHKDFSVKQQAIFKVLVFSLDLLGFNFKFGNYSQEIQVKIKEWEKKKTKKDFNSADLLRAELQELGVLPKGTL